MKKRLAWSQPTPVRWPARDGRPRVLVEDRNGATRWAKRAALEEAGFVVGTCGGPDSGHDCPLAMGEPCPMVEGADFVVFGLGTADFKSRDVLRTHRFMAMPATLYVEASQGELEARPSIYHGAQILTTPYDTRHLVDAVRRAAAVVPAYPPEGDDQP